MADSYKYSTGQPVKVCEGEHGLNVCTSGGRTTTLWSRPEESDHAVYRVLDPTVEGPPVASRHNNENGDGFNTLQTDAMVEFIVFGHSHQYPLKDYSRVAPLWRERLLAEARILARSIQGDQAIAREFLESDGSLGAWMSGGIAAVKSLFKGGKKPDISKYDKLETEAWQVSDSVKHATAADYEILHAAGLKFMHIREEQRLLNAEVHGRLEELIDAAHTGEVVSEETEDAAFWILDLYGQVVAKEPFSLFAYRFAVISVRAGAHGLGAKLAGTAAFHEFAEVMQKELPSAATGLLMGFLKKGFPKDSGPTEAFAEELIRIQLFVIFFTIEFAVFDQEKLSAEERAHPDRAYLSRLAEPLAEHIVSAVASIVTAGALKGLKPDDPIRKHVECLGAIIPVAINSTMREVVTLKGHSKSHNHTFADQFVEEGGWAVIRIIRDVGKAALEALIKGKMEKAHQADKTYYKALIVSVYLNVAPVDSSRVKGPTNRPPIVGKAGPEDVPQLPKPPATPSSWKTKTPRGKPGPDGDGNVGIAKLRPVAGEATVKDRSTPPVPQRARRKKVVVTPAQNRVPPNKRENLGSIGSLKNWEEIEAKVKLGELASRPDIIRVKVRDKNGKLIGDWYEVSERGAADLGSQAQAEQKALARASEKNLAPGSVMTMTRYSRATRDELKAIAEKRAPEVIAESAEKRQKHGPVLTILKDTRTGKTFEAINHKTPPDDLHPILAARLKQFKEEHPDGKFLHYSEPGTHSEIYALDAALKAREAAGMKVTKADLDEFVMYNEWLEGKGAPGPARCCPNCSYLTSRVESLTDKRGLEQ